MKNNIALNQDIFDIYPSLNYENRIKYPLNSCNCQYSLCDNNCNCNCHIQRMNYHKKSTKTIEQTFDLINNYRNKRNTAVNDKINIVYSDAQRNDIKLEYSKSMDKVKNSNQYEDKLFYNYNNNKVEERKSLAKINNEINQFKDKMNKDKEYLNNIQNKLFNTEMNKYSNMSSIHYNDTINESTIKNRKRAFSLTNKMNEACGYKSELYLKNNNNLDYEINDYYTEKRKIRNAIMNNNYIDDDIIHKKEFNSIQQDKVNDYFKNKNRSIMIPPPKRNSSFLPSHSNKNKYILNNSNNNKLNYFDNNEKIIRQFGFNNNQRIKNPEKKEEYNPNMKYLTIQAKDDRVQLKEKGIKLNDYIYPNYCNTINYNNNKKDFRNYINKYLIDNEINNYNFSNEKTKIKKDLIKYQIKKYNSFVDKVINENDKENSINHMNNKRKNIELNNIDLLPNYETIKSKYEINKNNFNTLPNSFMNKKITKAKSEVYYQENNKDEESILIISPTDINDNNIISYDNNNEEMKPKTNKYSKSNSISSNLETKNSFYNNNYNNNFKTISTFSLNIEKKEENNKDLLIQNLKQKIIDLESELNEANSELKNLAKIIEELKNKNKVLSIDKIDSFNYITIQNHIIKLNNRNLNINIKKNKKQNINNDELIIHFPKKSSLGKSPKKYVNSFTENEQFSYSSFDNYKNMNIYFRKITTTVNDQKIHKPKPVSLTKNSIRYNKNILLGKLNIKKDDSNNNNKYINNKNNSNTNLIKDMKMNEKIIYTIYSSKDNINMLFFDPEAKKFSFQNFKDNVKFKTDFLNNLKTTNKNNINISDIKCNDGNIFLYNEGYLYAVVGNNYDMFYKLDSYNKEIYKLSKLKYNHSNGYLIFYDQRIFCMSGDYNKKVECYIEQKNQWIDIPEMLTERSNFSCCIIKEQYLFALFGYNNVSKQYLNSIEYIDLLCENSKWRYLYYENNNNLSLLLIGAFGINYDDKSIIIFGGYNGQTRKGNNSYFQINLKKNFDEEHYEISDENLSNITKINQESEINDSNKFYFSSNGFNKFYDENNNILLTFFDDEFHSHIINLNSFSHEIYSFE